ncbi:helix-turn-helix domain-containing protein [Cupriavidus metallidurans]|nr:helix-turn-helix domain-containing protein [Cupriavidus metallidurans]
MAHTPLINARFSRETLSAWSGVVSSLFFDLDMEVDSCTSFKGQAWHTDLADVRLTRFQSTPVKYRRLQQHCDHSVPEVLVSVPLTRSLQFEQLGRQIQCSAGNFLLEYSNAPYQFRNVECNDMWVLKVPESMLQSRMGSITRFYAMEFDASDSVGKLFRDYIDLIGQNTDIVDPRFQALMASQCADLLAAVLEGDPRVACSSNAGVKAAHLNRIEQFVRENLADPDLSPEKVATACQISVRYLHLLFRESGRTLSCWVRELRLRAALEHLQRAKPGVAIAQTAYKFGFNDPAHFSSNFRKHFGRSPSEVLAEARQTVAVR